MARGEGENGREDMEIDEVPPRHHPMANAVPEGFNSNYLKFYYGKLFPHADIYKWLSYGNDGKHPSCDHSFFGRRELSFTWEKNTLVRFQSFNSLSEMENAIKEKCPLKIDIGPVYNVDPAKRRAYEQSGDNGFTPVERELIFDIDMTDYDNVRYCCSGADFCLDCWPLMTAAIKVIDAALRDDFGFDHILWVFSGRRGVHCWVCDGKARRLNKDQRGAIADYFRVYKGNANSSGKVSLTWPELHPFIERSYSDVLKDIFENNLLCSQNLFSEQERFEHILAMIPNKAVASELEGKWQENRRSSSKEDIDVLRWGQLKNILLSGKHKVHGMHRCVKEIVFSYSYPRLDISVTKHMNHLLKAPFCVHPATGRVCVPIDPTCCENFDPTTVPTLSELLGELNMGGFKADGGDEWDKTSLGKSIRYFRSSFLQPLLKACKEEMESSYSAKIRDSRNSISW